MLKKNSVLKISFDILSSLVSLSNDLICLVIYNKLCRVKGCVVIYKFAIFFLLLRSILFILNDCRSFVRFNYSRENYVDFPRVFYLQFYWILKLKKKKKKRNISVVLWDRRILLEEIYRNQWHIKDSLSRLFNETRESFYMHR